MFNVTWFGASETIAKLRKIAPAVEDSVCKTMLKMAIKVQRLAKQKVSGDVLKVDTGTLRASITAKTETSGGKVIAVVGSNVKYAARHEFGFHGTESVKEHMRRSSAQMKSAIIGKNGKEKSFSKLANKGKGSGVVSAFTRQVNYPAHSFLRSSLKELTPQIIKELELSAKKSAKDAMK